MITKFNLYEIKSEDILGDINYDKLYIASINGDFETIKKFINDGGNIHVKFDNKETLLSSALKNDHVETANYLIENGADINQVDYKNNSLLIQLCSNALYSGSEVMVQLLVDAGADLELKDNRGHTALMCASIVHEMKLVKTLIDGGSDWNITTLKGYDFIQMLHKKEKVEIIKLYPKKYKDYKMKKNMEKYKI